MISLATEEAADAKPVLKAFMQELDLLLVNAEHLLVLESTSLALLPRCYLDSSCVIPAMLLQCVGRAYPYPVGIITATSQESLIDILRHKAPAVAYYKFEDCREDNVLFTRKKVTMANPLFQRTDEEFLLMTEMASLSADKA